MSGAFTHKYSWVLLLRLHWLVQGYLMSQCKDSFFVLHDAASCLLIHIFMCHFIYFWITVFPVSGPDRHFNWNLSGRPLENEAPFCEMSLWNEHERNDTFICCTITCSVLASSMCPPSPGGETRHDGNSDRWQWADDGGWIYICKVTLKNSIILTRIIKYN